MELAILFQMTFIGMPCVFYGDEKGMMGMTESEYRMPMPWDAASPLTDVYKRLIGLRKSHPALTRGSFETVEAREALLRYARIWRDERIEIAVNPGAVPVSCAFPGDILLKKRLCLWFTGTVRLRYHKERSSWRTRSMIWQSRRAYPSPRYPGR